MALVGTKKMTRNTMLNGTSVGVTGGSINATTTANNNYMMMEHGKPDGAHMNKSAMLGSIGSGHGNSILGSNCMRYY